MNRLRGALTSCEITALRLPAQIEWGRSLLPLTLAVSCSIILLFFVVSLFTRFSFVRKRETLSYSYKVRSLGGLQSV